MLHFMSAIDTIVFDLGGVLIDWNPRILYRKILKTEEEISWFFENICTSEWNEQQDAGRSFAEATEELVAKHPEWEIPIRAWYGRWEETIPGPIHETVDLLKYFKEKSPYRLYALTNWSAESFPRTLQKFEFLHWFDGIVVSGKEKTRKPFPDIYQILFKRFDIHPSKSIFIDDNLKNIEAAKKEGMQGIHFQSPAQLKLSMQDFGLLVQ